MDAEEVKFLEGVFNARYLAVGSFVAFLYDYCLTFSDEVEHFWRGPRGVPQATLFFLNRYIPFIISPLIILGTSGTDLSTKFCKNFVHGLSAVLLLQAFIAQGILVIRVYFMYGFSRTLQVGTLFCFLVNIIISIAFTALSIDSLQPLSSKSLPSNFGGCDIPLDWTIWKTFLVALSFHVFLFVMTTARAFRQKHRPLDDEMRTIRNRLIQDGGFWYILILLSVAWTGAGSILDIREPTTAIPSMFSGFMQNLVSISISRLMLSIRSLAASLTFDPPWILNNSELTRLHLRKSPGGNDVLVEIAASDPMPFKQATQLRMTRIGEPVASLDLSTEEGYRVHSLGNFDDVLHIH